jgi:hypothetical protein
LDGIAKGGNDKFFLRKEFLEKGEKAVTHKFTKFIKNMTFGKDPEDLIFKEDPTDLVDADGQTINKWWK